MVSVRHPKRLKQKGYNYKTGRPIVDRAITSAVPAGATIANYAMILNDARPIRCPERSNFVDMRSWLQMSAGAFGEL